MNKKLSFLLGMFSAYRILYSKEELEKAPPFEFFVPSVCLYLLLCAPIIFVLGSGIAPLILSPIAAAALLEGSLAFLDQHG